MARLLLSVAFAAMVAMPAPAWACGGCFSPQAAAGSQTVLQSAERVLFVRDEKTQKTIVHVEVRYTGLASEFGWVLPLPKVPEVGVGTRMIFDALDSQLTRTFTVFQGPSENCDDPAKYCASWQQVNPDGATVSDSVGWADSSSTGNDLVGGGPGGVVVLASGATGPYDYTVVKGGDATALQKWLTDHGYATPANANAVIASHIAKGDVFVAIKLSNGKGVTAIRPIVLTMQDADPCVPLRLTAIAAAEELKVEVTLAGPGRAVAKNHLATDINPLRLAWSNLVISDWGYFNPALAKPSNYDLLLAAAIDEAGGHAFVTEASVKGAMLGVGSVWLNNLDTIGAVTDLLAAAKWLPQQSPDLLNDEVAATLQGPWKLATVFPNVPPLTAMAYLRSCGAYWAQSMVPQPTCSIPNGPTLTKQQLQAVAIDGPAAATAVTNDFAKPYLQAAGLIQAAPRVTRMVTRVSPAEMDRDPVFAFNTALPEVSAAFEPFKVQLVCTDGWDSGPKKVRATWAELGSWVVGGWGVVPALFKPTPAARWVALADEIGALQPVAPEDVAVVDAAIAGAKPGLPSLPLALVLKPVKPWLPPPSDPLVTAKGPWPKPPMCLAGVGETQQADAGGDLPALADSNAVSDAGKAEGGPVPGVDALGGWNEVAAGAVADANGVADATAVVVKPKAASSGCAAGGAAGGGWALLCTVAALFGFGLRRRFHAR